MTARRFEFKDAGSSKFWEVSLKGATITVRFGRIGTDGTAKDKQLATPAEATRELAKLVAEKTKKGYAEVTTAASPKKPTNPVKAPADGATAKSPAAAATPSTPAVDALLATIAKKEKPIFGGLRRGAAPEVLKTLRALNAPAAMLALYGRHDGSEGAFFGAYRLLSVAEMLDEQKTMRELAENPAWQKTAQWQSDWIPFAGDGDGQLLCFDPGGGTDDGPPGQIVAYDHETGPARELASFDVLVELWTTLAKKALLSEEAREESAEAFEEACDKARNVGLAKMPPKDLKKLQAKLDEEDVTDEQRLATALPLTKQYGAERDLWSIVAHAAQGVGNWELMARAAARSENLTPARDRPYMVAELVRALHLCGRDEQALAALKTGLTAKSNYPDSLVPKEVSPAFLHACYVVATESRPKDYRLWVERGKAASDPKDRADSFHMTIALAKDKELIRFNESLAAAAAGAAKKHLELDRIAQLAGRPGLEALIALAKGERSADVWLLVASAAIELADWKSLELAGDKLLKLEEMEHEHYKWGTWKLRALYELGRDADASKLLKKILDAAFGKEEASVLAVLPFSGALEGKPASEPKTRACEERALEVATEALPDNPHAWLGLGYAASKTETARTAFARVVKILENPELAHVPVAGRNPKYEAKLAAEWADLLALKARAQSELARVR